ncbi:MAG: hypothetical protein Q9216_002417 [Gyalolechia sp. 2 TL-2023]
MSQFLDHIEIPSLRSLYVEDGRLPDVGKDYTHIARPRRHLWSPEEKQILYILDKHYRNKTADIWKVFNLHFADKFSRLPKPRKKSFESMRNHNANPSRYRVWWTLPTTRRLQARLEREALSIGITLQAVGRKPFEVSALIPRKRRYVLSPSDTPNGSDLEWDSNQLETDTEDIRRTRVIRNPYNTSRTTASRAQKVNRESGLLTPPSTRKSNRQRSTITPVPPIAFRAFNPHSQGVNNINGFVAGSFVGIDITMIPAPSSEEKYLEDLERHLGRKHSGATPFISVCQNLLRVLVHALRRGQAIKEGKTEWNIAVISLSRISSSVRAVWDLDAGIHSRWAFGEWVDWRFPEHKTWLSNKEFMQGLVEAYQRTPRGFSAIAAETEQDHHSSGVRPLDYTNAAAQPNSNGHDWLADFLKELEEAALNAGGATEPAKSKRKA